MKRMAEKEQTLINICIKINLKDVKLCTVEKNNFNRTLYSFV